jgi:flagellar biosynthetic protein FliP
VSYRSRKRPADGNLPARLAPPARVPLCNSGRGESKTFVRGANDDSGRHNGQRCNAGRIANPSYGGLPSAARPKRTCSAPVSVAILVTGAVLLFMSRASWGSDDVRADAKSPAARSIGTDGDPAKANEGNNVAETSRRDPSSDQSVPAISAASFPPLNRPELLRTLQTVALFGLISIAPVGLLMVTAFVRINMVLILLRQALGSPQVPGNQVLTGLALLLTALVMHPIGEKVYRDAIVPYSAGQLSAAEAWTIGSEPIKIFMADQIVWTKHQDYLRALHEYAVPPGSHPGQTGPARAQDFPLRVVAPAYLLSELTTALTIGFFVYLPFLVIDLVVSSVLAATGLFMLPPALVAMPVKLIVFVLADGWMLVATMLLNSFAASPGVP